MKILEVKDLSVRYGEVLAVKRVSFSLDAGQSMTLLGPSGCGKTTLLRSIAGLETPTEGSIELYGKPAYDGAKGTNVPTERRNLSMMFQSYAIWPHMTVYENVAYGLKLRKLPEKEVKERVMNALELVGLGDYASRPSPNLSGGQQQRVALARSFVFNPRLILFDEALSNLDARLRTQMRVELKTLQAKLGIAAIYVTHDQEEALVMSDKVLVMSAGKAEQLGSPFDVYFQPQTPFVADFVGGSNVLSVKPVAVPANQAVQFETSAGHLTGQSTRELATCDSVAVKSVHIALSRSKPPLENCFEADIEERNFVGDLVEYVLRWGNLRLRVQQPSVTLYDCNARVWASIEPAHVIPLAKEGMV